MILDGIGLVKVLDLDPWFVEIAGVLAEVQTEVPQAVWVVVYGGQVIAVYLTPGEAYARLLLVLEGIQRGQLPEKQTLVEAELIRDLALNPNSASLAHAPRFGEDDQGPQP